MQHTWSCSTNWSKPTMEEKYLSHNVLCVVGSVYIVSRGMPTCHAVEHCMPYANLQRRAYTVEGDCAYSTAPAAAKWRYESLRAAWKSSSNTLFAVCATLHTCCAQYTLARAASYFCCEGAAGVGWGRAGQGRAERSAGICWQEYGNWGAVILPFSEGTPGQTTSLTFELNACRSLAIKYGDPPKPPTISMLSTVLPFASTLSRVPCTA